MDSSWLAIIISSGLISAFVSAILGPILMQGRDRLSSRAKAIEAIRVVEVHKWAGRPEGAFRDKLAGLEGATLIARSDRKLVKLYMYTAYVLRCYVDDTRTEGVPAELVELSSFAAECLIKTLWYPFITFPVRRHYRSMIERKINDAKTALKHDHVMWDVEPF